MQSKTIATMLASVFTLFGTGYVAFGLYMVLGNYFLPYQAALLTALAFFLLVFLIWVFFLRVDTDKVKEKAGRTSENMNDDQALLSLLMSDPELEKWIRRHPVGSLAMTTLAGVAVGYSKEARSLLRSFYQRSFTDED
jgi:hypothetical protein